MAFSFFSKSSEHSSGAKKDGQELSIVIDIESGLVRGSLVLFSHPSFSTAFSGPHIPPHVFYTTSSEITSRGGNTGVKLLSAMLDSVSRVAENIQTEGLKISSTNSVAIAISKIHVVFSSPWIISKTKTVKISYKKETEITKAAVDTILDSERRDLERQFISEHDNSLEFDLAFVEQKIFEVKLNGYPTFHFEDKKAKELEVSFAISISSKSILSRIEKAIEKSIRTAQRNVECHSSLLLQYSALRNIVPGNNDYVTIHVHNEISDIIVVKKGVCAGMASFPAGTAALSRISSSILGQSKEVTRSTLNLQSKEALYPPENHRVMVTADSSLKKWASQFVEAFASLGDPDSMPRRIYLLVNEHYSHFERALLAIKTAKVTPIEKSILDAAVSYENKEREDALMSLYIFALQ